MKAALAEFIKADERIAGLVSDRVFWRRRNQRVSELPAIVLYLVAAPRDYALSGATGYVESRVQAQIIARKYSETEAVKIALISGLNDLSGWHGGVRFQHLSIENERDSDEQESGAERTLFGISIDLLIKHDEQEKKYDKSRST